VLLMSLWPLAAPGLLGGLRYAPRARGVIVGLARVRRVWAGGVRRVDSVRAGVGRTRPVRTGRITTHGMRAGGFHRRQPSFARRRCAGVIPGLELLAGFLVASGHRLVPSYIWAHQENSDTGDGTPGKPPKFVPP